MKLIISLALLFSALLGAISGLIGGAAAVAIFVLIFPLIFILKDFRFGVAAVILVLPLANITLLGHIPGLNPANVLIAVTFGAFWLSHMMYHDPLVRLPRIIWWRYILPIGLATMVGLTHLRELTPLMIFRVGEEFKTPVNYVLQFGLKPLLFVLAAWLIGNAVRSSKHPERYLLAFTTSLLLLAAVLLGYILWSGLGLSVIGGARARLFLSPLGLHANEFGAMFATGFAVLLFMLPALKGFATRVLMLGAIGVVLVALLLTFSRGGYVAALAATLYFMVAQRRARLALASAVAVVVLALAAPQAVQDRFMTGLGGGSEGSHELMSGHASDDELTAGRMWLWRQTFPAFYKNPVTGSGLGSQAWSDAVKTGVVRTAANHNLYLSILYDTGLVGMVVVLTFFVSVYRGFKAAAQNPATPPLIAAALQGAAAALVGYGLMSFTNSRFWPQSDQVFLWFMFGISLAYLPAELVRRRASVPAAA